MPFIWCAEPSMEELPIDSAMKKIRLLAAAVLALCVILTASPCAGEENLRVFVTVPPQAYMAKRLGGPAVTVHTLINAGQDPHTYEPTPRQATDLGRAHLFFTVGMPFEKRLVGKVVAGNRGLKVVDSTAGIPRLAMEEDHHDEESGHHKGGNSARKHDHHEGQPDPHVWLAPANLQRMAETMAQSMMVQRPDLRHVLRRNLTALQDELAALDQRIAASLSPYQGRTFYVFHPAFGYFADAYNLRQKAVETGGKSPTPRQLAALIRRAEADRVRIIFVQPQFDAKSGAALAGAINGTVAPLDPLAHDVLGNLKTMADALVQAFTGAGAMQTGP